MAKKDNLESLAVQVEGLNLDENELGHGAYGVVYAVSVNGRPCIAKKLHTMLIQADNYFPNATTTQKDAMVVKFRNECSILSKLNHQNIVQFVGIHYGQNKSDLILVMERLHTDLSEFVKNNPATPLPVRLSILRDVSCGLLYLHTLTPPLIHRDLTAPNILLTENAPRAKIGDLGVSKYVDPNVAATMSVGPGNIQYMPPEAFYENPVYTIKLDIFSFGHLIVHTINGNRPEVYSLPFNIQNRFARDGKIELMRRENAVHVQMGTDHCLYPLVVGCLHDNPNRRPNTEEVNEALHDLCKRYPKETLYEACEQGNVERVRVLLEGGADPNQTNEDGWTALYIASMNDHKRVVEVLLEFGCDVDIQTNDGKTALYVSSFYGHNQIVQRLITAGAKLDTQKKTLHEMCERGNVECDRVLLEGGTDPNQTNEFVLDHQQVVRPVDFEGFGLSDKEKLDFKKQEKAKLLSRMDEATTASDKVYFRHQLRKFDEEITLLSDNISQSQFNDAMKAGFVTVDIINALICGIAGVGKTSFKNILLGLDPPLISNSTPLADPPIQIQVREVSGVKFQVGDCGWKQVEGVDLEQIVTDTLSSVVNSLDGVPESMKRELQEQVAKITSENSQQSSSVNSSEASSTASDQSAHGFHTAVANIMGMMVTAVAEKSQEINFSGRDPTEVMGSNWIYFTDSGGQPHFHNLLPHFVQGLSAVLFAFRLSERLDVHTIVEHFEKGQAVSAPFLSPLTTEDTIKRLVLSMQSCSVGGVKPLLVFLGTFLDKIQESLETLQEKNDKLFKIFVTNSSDFCDQAIFFNEFENELIFAVDASHRGTEQDEVAKLIRSIIEQSPARQIKVPMWWYVLEIVLQKLTLQHHRKVLSKAECLQAVSFLNFPEEAVIAALNFFHEQHLFHYFPDVLSEIVFCSPQVLLDKLTELVKYAYEMRNPINRSTSTTSQKCTDPIFGKRRHLRDIGIVTLELLTQFPKHYEEGLFTPAHLLQVFQKLLILTPMSSELHHQIYSTSSTAQYYMPSLLNMLPSSELQLHRVFSAAAAPMLVRFSTGWSHFGVFCCLQVYLIQNCKWELVLRKGKPKLFAQNCVMLSFPKSACVVTLIDSFSYFEVHVNDDKPSVCDRVCSLIRDDVMFGIDASCRALKYNSDLPLLAFFCPCGILTSTQHPSDRQSMPFASQDVPDHHAAVLVREDDRLKCTVDQSNFSQLQNKHRIWLPSIPSV